MSRRTVRLLALGLLAIGILASGLFNASIGMAAESSAPGGHEEHAAKKMVSLTPEQLKSNGIEVGEASAGEIAVQLALPGEVRLNADRVAHVVPRVAGVVREVFKNVGDDVKTGELMAVLDSRELATLKAAYLAAREREALAEATFLREKGLWEKKISAEQDYLAAKQALAEAAINTRSAEQQLHAIGCSEDDLKSVPSKAHASYTRYEMAAPFDGVVIEKHITLGESLKDDASCFTIADLRTVWVDLSVYQKDIPVIAKGQDVLINVGANVQEAVHGVVEHMGPMMGEDTRTVIARVVLPNENGRWRPGQFVTGLIASEKQAVGILAPKTAVQTLDKTPSVFVQTDAGFEATPVTLGRDNDKSVEIVSGLNAGQRYALTGSFVLKAMLEKGELHDEH